MTTSTNVDIEHLERLLKATTPGTWAAGTPRGFAIVLTTEGAMEVLRCTDANIPENIANTRFIAAAHNAIPALLSEVRALRVALAPFTLSADEWYETSDFPDDHPIPIVPDLPCSPDGLMLVWRVVPPDDYPRVYETCVAWSHNITMRDLRRASDAYGDKP